MLTSHHQSDGCHDAEVRTTVTLDPNTAQIMRGRMRERGLSFKPARNDSIRAGATTSAQPFRTRTYEMGAPRVNLDRALQLAGELEDEELVRRLRTGS